MSEGHDTKVVFKSLDFLVDEGYRVGNDGSVWSRRKLVPFAGGKGSGKRGFTCILSDTWKKLKPGRTASGHVTVSLRKDGKMKSYYIHRLVLEAFVGPAPENMECRHLNGKPSNNNLSNLAWGTAKENSGDRIRHGTQARGERMGSAKLKEHQVKRIRQLYATNNYSYQELADMYGLLSCHAIQYIINGRNWRHVL